MQSKTMSLVESLTNTVVGFIVSLISWVFIAKWYGITLSMHDNITLTLCFTVVSIVRGYVLRRIFNKIRFGHI